MRICKRELGQTLIEVLVALGTSVIVLSAIVIAVITSLNNLSFGRSQSLATQYAQEGMEVVRRIRNTNASFSSYSGEYCLSKNSSTLTSVAGNCSAPNDCALYKIDNFFIRRACIVQNSSDCNQQGLSQTTRAKVDVFWSDGKCSSSNVYCHSSSLISCFVNTGSISNP